jgi:hypothetical protein
MDAQSRARWARQILLAEVGVEGQRRIASAVAPVSGAGLEHEVASLYASRAGARTAAGDVDVDELAPRAVVTVPEAARVLAGARAALRVLARAVEGS